MVLGENDSGDPMTFHLVPQAGQIFHLSCEIPQHLLDGLEQNLLYPLTFPSVPP